MSEKTRRSSTKSAARRDVMSLRIIGGTLRGRKLRYDGDQRTRPMKDRVREALFNLLGPGIEGMQAIDLFAGTGAVGLEAISRGAAGATFVEQHYPTAETLQENIDTLGVGDRCRVVVADTLIWIRQHPELPNGPRVVLCCPPYDLYVERGDEMIAVVEFFRSTSPPGSMLAVEADKRFDFDRLPNSDKWDVREYAPSVIGILQIGDEK